MNIIAATMITGAIVAMPSASLPTNPIAGLSVSAAGIGVEFNADGVTAGPADTTDFKIELRTTSGTPIRVRL